VLCTSQAPYLTISCACASCGSSPNAERGIDKRVSIRIPWRINLDQLLHSSVAIG
jgi:hypothetical protein